MPAKRVLIPVADGFEEIETTTIVDILRRGGVEVILAGIKDGALTGSRGIRLLPDKPLDQVLEETFDLVVLPGGQPGVDNLRRDARVLELLRRRHKQKGLIGAICAAPLALRDAGVIQGVRLTSYPSIRNDLPGCRYDDSRVVLDDHFITSRSPGTAMEFALKLLEILSGKAKAEEVSNAVLARAL